jgi:hypothetical protein
MPETAEARCLVSYKFGPGQAGMVVWRGDSPTEVATAIVGSFDELLPMVESIAKSLHDFEIVPVQPVAASQPYEAKPQMAQQTGSGQRCGPNGSHGYRVHREGPPGPDGSLQWIGDFCPLGKTDPNRCKPIYSKQSSR